MRNGKRKSRYLALLVSVNTGSIEWINVNGWDYTQADKVARYYSSCLNNTRSWFERYTLKKLFIIK